MDDSWTMKDKKKLLMALQQYGPHNIAEVQKLLPDKTITDIRLAFEKYSLLAAEKISQQEQNCDEDSAINQWIKVIKKTQDSHNGVVDILPRVLKYIAFFEKRPNDKDVNLRDCYIALSQMTSGMASKQLNPKTNQFFFENLSRLALKIKEADTTKRRQFVRNLKDLDHIFKPQIVKTYNRKKKKVSVILNPLNVPEELLKNDEARTDKEAV
ncbi:uncharacterized protein LOC135127652 isoform X3 [Zophobas morio]|uniref:uncharacterized protein LOC135127652 isoform X2 n=1 Tax=Zophobas morio TaxID=2755281 RepID=UPI003083E366